MSATPKNLKAAPKGGSDRKKLFALLGLVAAGLLLWGRLLTQQVPRTVVAVPPAEGGEVAAQNTAEEADGSSGQIADAQAAMKAAPRRPVAVNLPPKLTRDLFAFDASGYARTATITPDEPDIRLSGKSDEKPTDDRHQDVEVARAASGLVLQTTILGDQPRAMINGQVLRPGQKIKGFELKKVLPRQVMLEMNGIEVRLKM